VTSAPVSRTGYAVRLAVFAIAALACAAAFGEDEIVIKGKPLSRWMKDMKGENRGLQLRASRALTEATAEQVPKIVPELIPLLGDARENTRLPAAQILGEYGPAARAAVPQLLPLLEGTQFERNRAASAKALGQILRNANSSPEVDGVVKALIPRFTDKYQDVRRESVRACGMIGPAAKACIVHLTPPLTEPIPTCFGVRREAAWTCGRMGTLAREHIDRLIANMHAESTHSNSVCDPTVFEAIARIGLVHENVIPNMIDAMEARGKWQMGDFPVKACWMAGLDALGSFGAKGKPAVPFLHKLARGKVKTWEPADVGALIKVVKALGAIGPDSREAVPALKKLQSLKIETAKKPEVNEALKKLQKELHEELEKALKAIES